MGRKVKTVPKRITVQRRQTMLSEPLTVSVAHGYLWIGHEFGPCRVTISGKATLHKIAAMLKAHAR